MFPVPEVSDAIVGHGGGYGADWLPPKEDYADYQRNWHNDYKGCKIAAEWFYRGLKKDTLIPRKGVDSEKAVRAIKSCLGSWGFSHEDKTALCGYLIDQWFTYKR